MHKGMLIITCFSVAFGGYRAGVYDIYVGIFRRVNNNKSLLFKALCHCLGFILINLATECVECSFHFITRAIITEKTVIINADNNIYSFERSV